VAKFYCAQPISVLSGRNACVVGRRYLFSAEILGLDNYKRQKLSMSEKIGGMKEKFCSRMAEYVKTSQSNTIFTEDLKSMVYIAESDAELDITLQMVRRFHLQNSDLRFSNFVFGPLVMRLLHMLNKPDEAYQLFTDKGLSGFFDQMSSFVILMDLLYDSKRYGQVLEVMDIVKDKQLGGFKYPMDCVTLAVASCYQLNTPESFKKLTSLIKDTGGAVGSVSLRSSIYASMLALTQGKPDVALELLSIVTIRPGLPTPVAYVNVKALTFAALGRVDDAIQTLRTIVDHTCQITSSSGGKPLRKF
jgi:pentatricopeptide repeat domain-containing protein 2